MEFPGGHGSDCKTVEAPIVDEMLLVPHINASYDNQCMLKT